MQNPWHTSYECQQSWLVNVISYQENWWNKYWIAFATLIICVILWKFMGRKKNNLRKKMRKWNDFDQGCCNSFTSSIISVIEKPFLIMVVMFQHNFWIHEPSKTRGPLACCL